MKQEKSYLGIELLRFLCAIAVVVWHYQHFYMGVDEAFVVPFTREMQPLAWLLKPFYGWGYMSVSIFWEISGFIFFWKYHEAIADGAVTARSFFVLRFSRLYPLHVAMWVLVAGMQIAFAAGHDGAPYVYGHNDLRHFLLGLGFASSWGFEQGLSFNGPIWSVSVEVLVYAVFFALSLRIRADLIGRICLVVATIGLWLVNERFGSPVLRLPLSCATYFFTGGMVHAVSRRVPATWLRNFSPFALAAALAAGVLFFQNDGNTSKVVIIGFATLLLVGFLGLDLWPRVDRLFAVLAPAADMTYSSYLVHFPIQLGLVTVTDRLGFARTLYDSPLMLALFFGLVFGSAWIAFHRYERPAQAWIRRLMLARRPMPTGVAAE